MTTTILDGKAFNRKLAGVVRSFKLRRQAVQELLEDAQAFFYSQDEEGNPRHDATRFTDIVNKLHGTGVVATVKLCDYIEAIAPVRRAKGKNGVKFKVNHKAIDTEFTIDKTWYDFNREAQEEQLLDVDKLVHALTNKLTKSIDNLDPNDPEHAVQIDKATAVLAALKPAPEVQVLQ